MNREFRPTFPRLGRWAQRLAYPFVCLWGRWLKFYTTTSRYARRQGEEMERRLRRGETVYLLGLGPGGHNAAAALVEVSPHEGVRLICNNEEERYTGVKHESSFPENGLADVGRHLEERNLGPDDIFAVVASWDYLAAVSHAARLIMEEWPLGLTLMRPEASPNLNASHLLGALRAPLRLKAFFGSRRRVPVIGMRHHNNHAYFSYAVSPFAGSSEPVAIAVMDGYGDEGPISLYTAQEKEVRLLRSVPGVFDSLGLLYSVISSTQGGWTTLSSEGRYMGASAWGDNNRLTNPYYRQLRQILYCAPQGQVAINRALIHYHRRGEAAPYKPALVDLLGPPIPRSQMWNPDAVLNVDNIEHAEITQQRVDKAAALQLVLEDAIFHIVDHLLQETQSQHLILSGGIALNCIANMRLLDELGPAYFRHYHNREEDYLRLWVPPTPSDTGVALGAAYHFALRYGASLGEPLRHAFYCGCAPTASQIQEALDNDEEMKSLSWGNIHNKKDLLAVTDRLAFLLSQNGVVGLFQGAAETGPRALGHRTIMANPCHPDTLAHLNEQVKYRERIRPLAPMVTLEEAKRLFFLAPGAAAAQYNAYNYMVLTVQARPESLERIPAVIHKDGTSRIQIVRADIDPVTYHILQAMGRYVGVEAMVNTSLNVGSPIVQTPAQALGTLRRSRGLTALVFIDNEGEVTLVWHHLDAPPKDKGQQLQRWLQQWEKQQRSTTLPPS